MCWIWRDLPGRLQTTTGPPLSQIRPFLATAATWCTLWKRTKPPGAARTLQLYFHMMHTRPKRHPQAYTVTESAVKRVDKPQNDLIHYCNLMHSAR